MQCPSCDRQNIEEAEFCAYCGEPLPLAPIQTTPGGFFSRRTVLIGLAVVVVLFVLGASIALLIHSSQSSSSLTKKSTPIPTSKPTTKVTPIPTSKPTPTPAPEPTAVTQPPVTFKAGGISFIGPVKSITSSSLVMSAPDGQIYTMAITAQTDLSAFGGNLPSVGALVDMNSAINPDGSFTATILRPGQSSDPNLNVIGYTGITTSAVGADRVIHFTVGVNSYTFTIPATADLSNFGGNAQAIGNNIAVKVNVSYPAITVVSVGNPNA